MNSQKNQTSSNLDKLEIESKTENLIQLADHESIHYDGRHYNLICENNYFDPGYATADIPFWIEMANRYSDPILELCCGNGRITIPLAEKGWQITGIDISQSMLEYARKKCPQVEWIETNVQDFALNRKFSLIMFPHNSIGHILDSQSIENCLNSVRQHLQPDGRFIIDIENYLSEYLLEFLLSKNRNLFSVYEDPDGKGTVVVTYENELDWTQQMWNLKLFFRLAGKTQEILEETKVRLYFPKELEMLLKYHGFTIEHQFGDYDLTPFTSQSPRLILICRG